uniref:TSC22 domain family protein 3 n=1 Tax=Gallus gallus TaxID=9031 RepID=A0A8V0YHV7_CHICK
QSWREKGKSRLSAGLCACTPASRELGVRPSPFIRGSRPPYSWSGEPASPPCTQHGLPKGECYPWVWRWGVGVPLGAKSCVPIAVGRPGLEFGGAASRACTPTGVVLCATWWAESASGASVVAIDNKIEQAMDLVKNHLMYAVREEVEVLKEQIKELLEKNSQLERENSLLKTLASPEQLEKFQSRLPSEVLHPQEQSPGAAPPAQHSGGSAV